jgi:hypothetical protein
VEVSVPVAGGHYGSADSGGDRTPVIFVRGDWTDYPPIVLPTAKMDDLR